MHVHVASRLTFVYSITIWFWCPHLAAGRSLKCACCRADWGTPAKKRPNLVYQQSKKLWQIEGVRSGFGCSERGPQQRKVWKPLLYDVILYVIVKVSFLFSFFLFVAKMTTIANKNSKHLAAPRPPFHPDDSTRCDNSTAEVQTLAVVGPLLDRCRKDRRSCTCRTNLWCSRTSQLESVG